MPGAFDAARHHQLHLALLHLAELLAGGCKQLNEQRRSWTLDRPKPKSASPHQTALSLNHLHFLLKVLIAYPCSHTWTTINPAYCKRPRIASRQGSTGIKLPNTCRIQCPELAYFALFPNHGTLLQSAVLSLLASLSLLCFQFLTWLQRWPK